MFDDYEDKFPDDFEFGCMECMCVCLFGVQQNELGIVFGFTGYHSIK